MVRKETTICDVCQTNLATGICDVCQSDICKNHTKNWSINLGNGYLTRIKLCQKCVNKIEYSKGMEDNEELKRIILEFIKKQMVIDGLKDE